MRLLRQSIVQRVLSLSLLAGLGLWLAAPATGAARPAVSAPLDAPPTVEAALVQALASAQEARTPEAFVAAFAAALGADPDLARFIEHHSLAGPGGSDALLAVLYGHLLRAFGHERGIAAAPAPPVATSSGAAPGSSAELCRDEAPASARSVSAAVAALPRVVVPLAALSAAQPLGP